MELPLHALLTRLLLLATAATAAAAAGDGCRSGFSCDALASYLIARNQNLTYIASLFGFSDYHTLKDSNPGVSNLDYIVVGQSVNISVPCGCQSLPNSPSSTYLAGFFSHKVQTGDTYDGITLKYGNLTNPGWLAATNTYSANNIPDTGTVNVTVNCSCGDSDISPDYGFFLTYPLRDGQTLASIAANNSFNSTTQLDLLNKYNPGMDTKTSGLIYIPVKDATGSYRPLTSPGQILSFCKLITLPH